MDLIFSAAIVSLLIIAVAAVWPAMYAIFSRAVASDTRELNLWQVMRRRGLNGLSGRDPEIARAMYRCIACPEAAGCDERLAECRFDEIDQFCPNRAFLDHLAAKHRRA